MGLKFNGRLVSAMRFNGRDAVEARCNGSVVWPVGDNRLRFVAEEAGSTITLQVVGTLTTVPVLEYSLDAGETWTEFSCDNAPVITLANAGDTVWMRGDNTRFASGIINYTEFVMTGRISAYGSIEYLRNKNGDVNALGGYCYYSLFQACTSLITAPELPATMLANWCYAEMFRSCTRLTAAPELPATTLDTSCYYSMFRNCISLIAAPELPATTLSTVCYYYMFEGCTSLNYIRVAFDIWNPSNATTGWVIGVAATGTFVCPEGLEQIVDTSHIPPGWTVRTF